MQGVYHTSFRKSTKIRFSRRSGVQRPAKLPNEGCRLRQR